MIAKTGEGEADGQPVNIPAPLICRRNDGLHKIERIIGFDVFAGRIGIRQIRFQPPASICRSGQSMFEGKRNCRKARFD